MLNFFATVAALAAASFILLFALAGTLGISNFILEWQQAGNVYYACATLGKAYASLFILFCLANCVGALLKTKKEGS